jgi:flagellar hook-associated protein 1 FlgK
MSLNTALSIAVQSLSAASGELQVTNNNIANANTTGYTRQVAVLQEVAPTADGTISSGNGVELTGYQSIRDEVLQSQINQETTTQSGANAELSSLNSIEPTFTTSTNDIGTEMSAVFSSISSLSTDATNSTSRQAVLTAGQNLATAFNTASSTLTTQQSGLNTQVTQDVDQINELSTQIAALNPQIAVLKASGQDGGTLEDQQNALVLKLSALTNVSETQTQTGMMVTTGSGTTLVQGSQSYSLQTATGSDGTTVKVVDQSGTDITSTLTGGDLGGTIQTRDTTIPGLLTQLNTLANQFAGAINTAQESGTDQNGTKGAALYSSGSTTDTTITAANITMATTDPAKIAASSDGSAGGTGNLTNLSAVQTTTLASGETPGDAYASLVYQVGSLTSNANSESTATTASLKQLNTQLSSVSGVSIDEESANLITYQTAYEAAARVVSTIQGLFTTLISMGTAAAE